MNARPVRMDIKKFAAWRIAGGKNYPLDCRGASSIEEAVSAAAPSCQHKDQLAILSKSDSGKIVTFFQIKQGARQYRINPETGVPGWIAPLKPVLLFSMAVSEFVPIEPWGWHPGADAVGADSDVTLVQS